MVMFEAWLELEAEVSYNGGSSQMSSDTLVLLSRL